MAPSCIIPVRLPQDSTISRICSPECCATVPGLHCIFPISGTLVSVMHAGESPPKAGICTLLFNPTYKFIVVKNTKVAGTSLFLKFGGFCPPGITPEKAKVCCSTLL